jgi:hypothetical protein
MKQFLLAVLLLWHRARQRQDFADDERELLEVPASTPSRGEDVPFGRPLGVRPKEDGSFLVENISRGRYGIQVNGSPDLYVRSVRYEGRDGSDEELLIDGPLSGALEVILDRPSAKVSGIVRDSRNEPVAYGRIVEWTPMSRAYM